MALRDAIDSLGEYEVLSRDDLKAVAERMALKQQSGDCDDDQCLLNFGRALGTRYMVAGSLARVGSMHYLSLRLLDTEGENAGVRKRASSSSKCSEEDLFGVVASVAAKLMDVSVATKSALAADETQVRAVVGMSAIEPEVKASGKDILDVVQKTVIEPELKVSGKERVFSKVNVQEAPDESAKQPGLPYNNSPAPKAEKSGFGWWKWGLGVVAVGVIAAAAGGGGGGSDGGSPAPATGTGTVSASW